MDNISAQFLLDTLKPYTPVLPHVTDPYTYLQQGIATGQAFTQADQNQQLFQSKLDAGQAAEERDALKSPYEIALLKAKTDALPLDRKYNQEAQAATVARINAQAYNYQSMARDRHAALLAKNGAAGSAGASTADDIMHTAGLADPALPADSQAAPAAPGPVPGLDANGQAIPPDPAASPYDGGGASVFTSTDPSDPANIAARAALKAQLDAGAPPYASR